MVRPTKWRRIEHMPDHLLFVPSANNDHAVSANIIKMEELEAVRLKDLEGLEQEECALKMEVSRPTFQRILLSARKKIADSLINGKAIRIEGGNYTLKICPVKCTDCGREWLESYENLDNIKNKEYACPNCNSINIICFDDGAGRFCRRNCRRYGRKK